MKKLVWTLLAVAAAIILLRALRREDANDPKLLFDHYWIDHEPRNFRDQFQGLFVSGEYPVGNFQVRTVWTGRWEGFHYHLSAREADVLDALFPNSDEQRRVKWRARKCDEHGFDLCLDVEGAGRGAARYYSKSEWRVKAGETDPAARLFPVAADTK